VPSQETGSSSVQHPDSTKPRAHQGLQETRGGSDVAGLAPRTLEGLVKPIIEVCDYYGLPPWRITSRYLDRYFAGPGRRAGATMRQSLRTRP